MKKLVWFCITAMTVSSFIACGVKDRNKIPTKVRAGEKAQTNPQAKTGEACEPGKAGVITVAGKSIITQNKDNANVLDERITTDQIRGLRASDAKLAEPQFVLTAKLDSSELLASTQAIMKDASKSEFYINLNCNRDSLPNHITKKTEVTVAELAAKPGFSKTLAAVYICGEQKITGNMISLNADVVVLDKANIEFLSTTGGLSIITNTLKLTDDNAIRAITQNEGQAQTTGISLSLRVVESLEKGSGTLQLLTVGRSCVADDSNADDTKSDDTKEPTITSKTEEKLTTKEDSQKGLTQEE